MGSCDHTIPILPGKDNGRRSRLLRGRMATYAQHASVQLEWVFPSTTVASAGANAGHGRRRKSDQSPGPAIVPTSVQPVSIKQSASRRRLLPGFIFARDSLYSDPIRATLGHVTVFVTKSTSI